MAPGDEPPQQPPNGRPVPGEPGYEERHDAVIQWNNELQESYGRFPSPVDSEDLGVDMLDADQPLQYIRGNGTHNQLVDDSNQAAGMTVPPTYADEPGSANTDSVMQDVGGPMQPAAFQQRMPPGLYQQRMPPGLHQQRMPPGPHQQPTAQGPYQQPMAQGPYQQPTAPAPYQLPMAPRNYQQPVLPGTYWQTIAPGAFQLHMVSPALRLQGAGQQPVAQWRYQQPTAPATNQQPPAATTYQQYTGSATYQQPTAPRRHLPPTVPATYQHPPPYQQSVAPGRYLQPIAPVTYRRRNNGESSRSAEGRMPPESSEYVRHEALRGGINLASTPEPDSSSSEESGIFLVAPRVQIPEMQRRPSSQQRTAEQPAANQPFVNHSFDEQDFANPPSADPTSIEQPVAEQDFANPSSADRSVSRGRTHQRPSEHTEGEDMGVAALDIRECVRNHNAPRSVEFGLSRPHSIPRAERPWLRDVIVRIPDRELFGIWNAAPTAPCASSEAIEPPPSERTPIEPPPLDLQRRLQEVYQGPRETHRTPTIVDTERRRQSYAFQEPREYMDSGLPYNAARAGTLPGTLPNASPSGQHNRPQDSSSQAASSSARPSSLNDNTRPEPRQGAGRAPQPADTEGTTAQVARDSVSHQGGQERNTVEDLNKTDEMQIDQDEQDSIRR